MISLKDVSKSYTNNTVLNAINYTFEPAKVYGIIGENGAGKTTLFRCIAGLEDYKGSILADRNPLKNHLGFLTSDPYFMSKMTAQEYLYLMADARKIKIKALEERNIFELPMQQYVSSYSTGMKKKLALMGILIQNNDYFILDEPYNGIDFESSIMLTAIIANIKKAAKTVLISSHIFSTLKDTCDEILILENGMFSKGVKKTEFEELEERLKQKILLKNVDKLYFNR